MRVTMNSDVRSTNHRRLDTAFREAAHARNLGAQHVTIEWRTAKGYGLTDTQYAFEKTSDGVYAKLRYVNGKLPVETIMRINNFALQHGLPFSPTESWARTDGEPVI